MKKNLPEYDKSNPKDTFPVDGNYFDDLEKSILQRTQKGRFVLESDIPLALTAPEGYFEELEQDVFDETINIKIHQKSNLKVSYKSSWSTVFRVAALLIAVLGIGWALVSYSESTSEDNQVTILENIQEEEILAYLESTSLDESLFLEVFEGEINELELNTESFDLEADFAEEDLKYFLDEDELLEI